VAHPKNIPGLFRPKKVLAGGAVKGALGGEIGGRAGDSGRTGGEKAAGWADVQGTFRARGLKLADAQGVSDFREPEINPTRPMVGSYYCG
jgi:hypothetical protein